MITILAMLHKFEIGSFVNFSLFRDRKPEFLVCNIPRFFS